MNAGDTAFILLCAAFVFIMTPGLAFFYGGMVRRKNVGNTMMQCVFIMGVSVIMWVLVGYALSFGGNHAGIITMMQCVFIMGVSVIMWVLVGYALSFGGNHAGIIGGAKWFGFNGVGMKPGPYADTIPNLAFAAFQMMFAMITPALITGSVAGRMKFKALVLFIILWSLIVYYPMAHMVWGEGGFLAEIGSVDFAGGNVVHITSGVSGLVLALTLGKRRGYDQGVYHVHNTPFVFLGAALLWFGWYGFNAGSALAANGLAAHAFMTTSVSAAAALVSWMLIEVFSEGKTTLVGASTGLVIGLVAITPGAGFVPMWAAVICGLLVSPICYFGVKLIKGKLKIDDALDAFGCHGIGGIWGGIATGLFGMTSINGVAKWNGLVFGETRLFVAQIIGILVSIAVAVVGSLICIAIVRIFTPLRVEERAEKVGLDVSEHGENAYPSFNGLD